MGFCLGGRLAYLGATRAGVDCAIGYYGVGIENCLDERCPQPDVDRVIENALRPLGVPIVSGLPFGHTKPNYAWPVGGRATIDGTSGEFQLLEWGVDPR